MKLTDVTPNLVVSDIERSTAFYRDVLGFSIVQTVPDGAPFVFVWLRRDEVSVFVNAAHAVSEEHPGFAKRTAGGTNTMFFTMEAADVAAGIDALFEHVKSRAPVFMPLKDQFYGMREFGIEDPDGHVVLFAQRTGDRG
jgi:uncharacterized glyoxalase superfamily protein PhnB